MDLKGLSNARWKEFPRATRAWKQWYIDHCTAVCHEFSNCQNQYSILKCRPWQNLVKEVVAAKTENQNYSCHLLPSTDLILMSGLVLCALHDMFCDLQMGAANWMYCSKMPLPCSRARVLRFRLLQSTEPLFDTRTMINGYDLVMSLGKNAHTCISLAGICYASKWETDDYKQNSCPPWSC